MTQTQTVLSHLEKRASISPMEALVSYGIYRLSDVIFRLRERGFGIDTEMRHDEAGHKYARYTLTYNDRGEVYRA